jgi:putative ABC transport system permease protein
MRIREAFGFALESLRANPIRSLLTSFGVLVGVAAVVVLVGVTSGIGGYLENQFESMLSSRAFDISLQNPGFHDIESMTRSRSWPEITADQAEDLEKLMSTAAAVAWSAQGEGTVLFKGETAEDVSIRGYSSSYAQVSSTAEPAEGRFFSWAEDEAGSRVCILGAGVAEALGLSEGDLGTSISIDGHRFTLIGIGGASGSVMGRSLDDYASIPFGTFRNLFSRPGQDVRITVLPGTGRTLEECREEAATVMRRLRGLSADDDDNFYIVTQESALSSMKDLLSTVTAVTVGMAAISLLVGGIGIMNITLVSVAERTREIGTRRALGARSADVVAQFMAEALAVSILGGMTGLAVGILAVMLVGRLTPLPAVVSGWSLALGLGFSTAVGLLFGVFPAWKASVLPPAEALRYE